MTDPDSDPARWFACSPVGVAVFDAECRFLYVNDVLAAINGRPAAGHVGQNAVELLGPAARLWMQMVSRVVATGEALGPMRLTQENWGTHAYEVGYYPVGEGSVPPEELAAAGSAARVIALVRDITPVVEEERRHQALAAVAAGLSTAASPDEVADAIASGVVSLLADGVAVGLVDATARGGAGGVRIVALRGYPAALHGRWTGRVVPLGGNTTVGEAVTSREPVVVTGAAEIARRYPKRTGNWEVAGPTALLAVPVLDDRGDVVAAVHLDWTEERRAAAPDVAVAQTLAQLAAAALIRVRQAHELERDRFRTVLDAMLDNVAVGCAIRGPDGEIVDFELEYLNRRSTDGAGRTAEQLIGARVLELYPAWRSSGLFDRFVTVVETGVPFVSEELHYTDLIDGVPVDGWWSIEVVRFGDGYLASSRDVTQAVRARRELADARAEREADRAAVTLLNRYAQPLRLPHLAWVQCAGTHRAADTVPPIGGDWYDAFTLDDGRVGLIVGDVAGHGRGAAELMIETRQLLADATTPTVDGADAPVDPGDPAAVLARVNDALRGRVGRAYVTCVYVVADPSTRTITVGCAGHPPPLLFDGAAWALLAVEPGPPLGVCAGQDYVTTSHALAPAAAVVLYTDGLVEHPQHDIDAGLERLVAELRGCASTRSATALRSHPHRLCELAMSAADTEPRDDVCVLAAQFDLAPEHGHPLPSPRAAGDTAAGLPSSGAGGSRSPGIATDPAESRVGRMTRRALGLRPRAACRLPTA